MAEHFFPPRVDLLGFSLEGSSILRVKIDLELVLHAFALLHPFHWVHRALQDLLFLDDLFKLELLVFERGIEDGGGRKTSRGQTLLGF